MRHQAMGHEPYGGRRTRALENGRGRGFVAMAVTLVCLLALAVTTATAGAVTTTYTATQTVPVPPASNFAGSGGGDGWAVALSSTAVYNVFHHQGTMQVACHLQSNAEPCFTPETIKDAEGNDFATSGEPGLYLDKHTGKLYVYGTRTSDETAGVVCIDTTLAPTNPDPFCGFTALTGVGQAKRPGGIGGASAPMLVGSHFYSFNFVNGVAQNGAEDALMCFDVSTDAACAGQPFDVAIGSGTVSDGGYPSPATAAIGSKVIIPIDIEGTDHLACFDDATQGSCAGSWPVALTGVSYASVNGAPFPLLSSTGTLTGVCIPTGTDQCFDLAGNATATPAGMSAAIEATSPWNGPAFVLGPRVYVPNGNYGGDIGDVQCYDYATGAGCANFPKQFSGLDYLYTVNPDPQRPTCIWVNSDSGTDQIQNFDAYTGEACGQGPVRVLASQFVVPQPQCVPASYVSLQILQPARATYAGGSILFDDGDGNPIPGLAEVALDGTGTASLAGLPLNTATGLPQFLITLSGETGGIGSVEVRLTWTGDYNATCLGETTTIVTAAPAAVAAKPKATGGVAAFGVAHLASRPHACVASSTYAASVGGSLIASVTFTVNGHKVGTLKKPNSHGRFLAHIKVRTGHAEKLVVHVVYKASSKVHTATLKRTLARCAVARHHSKPRFTG
jgi:hypothetical protein